MSDDHYIQRARDVEHLIKTDGFERGAYKALLRIAEDNTMLRQELKEVTKLVNKMADIVADIATVGQKLREEWKHIERKYNPDNEANPNQKWRD